MSAQTWSRITAAVVSTATFVFLFLHDSWHADNLFLIPDLLLCAVLAVVAALPSRVATPWLIAGLSLAAGVLLTSVSSYAVRGEFGIASLLGVIACVVAVVLSAHRGRGAVSPAHRTPAP
ncbi:hypothetical protein LX16_1318 [Stackebrandtia albiflava]|uniref:Uncharacterized protein n=1 Tax=Stackebrandtia albiflava TaxID=406432 RepID=A0A562VCQ4_9ACTN|nr:hypothetical protein [Stackebrandtia albiflava]TWJ15607.1 hypothetical protein LX16_1318 [Stackebrandtia albiflava]